MTPTDARMGWLAELKEGNKVISIHRSGRSVCTVEKITPGGYIVLKNGSRYSPSGRRGDTWDGSQLMEWTEDLDKSIRHDNQRARRIRQLRDTDWASQTDELLHDVLAAISDHTSYQASGS